MHFPGGPDYCAQTGNRNMAHPEKQPQGPVAITSMEPSRSTAVHNVCPVERSATRLRSVHHHFHGVIYHVKALLDHVLAMLFAVGHRAAVAETATHHTHGQVVA